MKKLFAWDFHGTLEQGTEVGFAQILRSLAREINYEVEIELEEVRRLYGMSILDYLKHFFPKLTNTQIESLRDKLRTRQNRKHLERFVKPVPYADLVLSKIKEAGHKNIIVSTSSEYRIAHFLEIVGIIKYFDKVFGIDRHSLGREFNIAREKSVAIGSFAKKINVEPKNIVAIGDRPGDIDAGIIVGAVTYQYINPLLGRVETNADFKIYDLREILREV